MERSPMKVPSEDDDEDALSVDTARPPVTAATDSDTATPVVDDATGFEDDTLPVTADVYKNEGNEAFKKGDFLNAIHLYTEGIQVNCKDKELKAKLYNNRAIAHSKLGNHQDSLSDAKAANELEPTFLKAIVRGASACVELKRFEETISWCEKGLAVSFEGICTF